jgi:thiamine biosynthesis lipoprotein
MITTEFRAMGSRIFLAMDSERDLWPELREPVVNQFEEWEQVLSRFRSTSELSEFNRNAGKWQKVSEVFWRVLTLALAVEIKSNGIVTPAVLNALEAAGYTVSFDDMGNTADRWLRQPLAEPASVREIEMDESTHSVRLPHGLRLDFGGVAKGWAVNETMLMLKKYAPVLVDGGGDIAVSGSMRDGSAWPVGITDPFNSSTNLGLIMLSSGAVATSGRDYRRWQVNGHWQHHLIDPRIQAPAETDVLTATVVADSVIEAEALSKQSLILGSREAVELFHGSSAACFLVLEDGSTVESNHFNDFRWQESCKIIHKEISI